MVQPMSLPRMMTLLLSSGIEINWSETRFAWVPPIVEPEYIQISKCCADYVLLVEKGTQ